MTTPLLSMDTLCDRREVWGLLHRLDPRRRVAYLERCCRRASRPGRPAPAPVPEMADYACQARRCGRADDRLTNMVYLDLIACACQYDLDLAAVAVELERYVRTGDLPPLDARASVARRSLSPAAPGGPPASSRRRP